jgi:hypothetical protein
MSLSYGWIEAESHVGHPHDVVPGFFLPLVGTVGRRPLVVWEQLL